MWGTPSRHFLKNSTSRSVRSHWKHQPQFLFRTGNKILSLTKNQKNHRKMYFSASTRGRDRTNNYSLNTDRFFNHFWATFSRHSSMTLTGHTALFTASPATDAELDTTSPQACTALYGRIQSNISGGLHSALQATMIILLRTLLKMLALIVFLYYRPVRGTKMLWRPCITVFVHLSDAKDAYQTSLWIRKK